MFSFVPTSAAPVADGDFPALLASARCTAAALAPHLIVHRNDGTTVAHAARKVVSCHRVYSAILRSDGTLLLLTSTPTSGAHVSVLESGGEAVRDVAAGTSHFVYCTVSGAVYSCGYDNTYGQLGDGTVWSAPVGAEELPPPLSRPRRIPGFGDKAVTGAAGHGWGTTDLSSSSSSSAEDAAGDTQEAGAEPAPRALYVPPPCSRSIRQVACGGHHTLLLTQTGRCVYTCGRGDHGQLGSARAVLVQPSFRSISLLFGLEMRQVAAADTHSFALLESGVLYAFGDNVCGQLGLGNTKRALLPTFVPLQGQSTGVEGSAAAAGAAKSGTTGRPVALDGRAYASLRAPYNSAASTYYPLRVPRLQADVGALPLSAGALLEACVTAVHCCPTWTLLETSRPDIWLSCGVALTRGVAAVAPASRIDGCGVLGRALLRGRAEDAYCFQPVQWPVLLRAWRSSWDVKAAPPEWAQEESVGGPPFRVLKVPRQLDRDEEGMSHTRCTTTATTAVGASGTIHQSSSLDPRRRGSDTEPSLCNTKKMMKGEEVPEGSIRVSAYATTLLVVLAEEEEGEGWAEAAANEQATLAHVHARTSRLLVQSGTPSAVAVEVPTSDAAAAWGVVTGSPVDVKGTAEGGDAMQRVPSGASLLQVRSSHRQFIPLPSYALFL